jgi:hypothetical protein
MRQIINIKNDEVIIYEITDQYLKECFKLKDNLAGKNLYLTYLKNCEFEDILLDSTKCIFSDEYIMHFLTTKTDGDWLWSADLEHYFEKYNFIWPDEHLKKITNSAYKLSENSKHILKKRIDLESELNNRVSSIEIDSFRDLIVQNRSINVIKLSTIK